VTRFNLRLTAVSLLRHVPARYLPTAMQMVAQRTGIKTTSTVRYLPFHGTRHQDP
jgi:hypothetical protein